MPSSHGGGFGGGFSGGGGFHSSGSHSSGGASTPRFSNKAFPGATRYAYVNPAGILCVFYYQGRPTRVKKSSITMLAVLLAFFIILSVVIPTLMMPRKLSEASCKFSGSYFSDNAGIVSYSQEDDLNAALAAFYEKTGVQPYLYTLKAENFPSKYGSITSHSLEEYAYDLYEKKFNDEGHWLIVFVEYDKSPYFAWIDMCGDNASSIVNDGFFKDFQYDMQTYLQSQPYTHVQGIIKSFNNATERALEVNGDVIGPIVIFAMIFIFLDVFIGISLVASIKQYFMINGYLDYEEKNPKNKDVEDADVFKKNNLDQDVFR